jgi:hypothetical protein
VNKDKSYQEGFNHASKGSNHVDGARLSRDPEYMQGAAAGFLHSESVINGSNDRRAKRARKTPYKEVEIGRHLRSFEPARPSIRSHIPGGYPDLADMDGTRE